MARLVSMSSGMPLKNLFSLSEPFGSALAAGAVVRDQHDHRVLELFGLLQIAQQPADLGVGVGQEPGVDLGHAAEQPRSSADSEAHGRVKSSAGKG